SRAMRCISSRLDSYVDNGAGLPTVLAPRILLCFEFFDSVDGQHRARIACSHDRVHHALGHPRIVAVDTIDHKIVVVWTAAISAVGPAGITGVFGHARSKV